MNISQRKYELRKEIRSIYKGLDENYKLSADRIIFEKLIKSEEYLNAESILCFYGTETEINTVPIMEKILSDGKTLLLPKCINKEDMIAYKVNSLNELAKGMYGIMEPSEEAEKYEKSCVDLVIVPCVSCNQSGARLGHGAGYYDRYLGGFTGSTVMICRKKLMKEEIPTSDFDVRIVKVISD